MGLMVLLQGVMLQGAARRVRTVPNSCCKGASEGCCCALQGAVVGFFSEAAGPVANGCKEKSSQNTSSDLANVPRFRIGKFEVWFGYDSGMIPGMIRKPIFFWIQEALLLESSFPTVNLLRLLLCQWLQWLDLPDDLGQDLSMKNVKISMHIYDLYPPACRRLFWMFFSCTFSSATLRLMFLFDGVLVWLPASQPASHPEPASLGIMMRLCARGEDSPTLIN